MQTSLVVCMEQPRGFYSENVFRCSGRANDKKKTAKDDLLPFSGEPRKHSVYLPRSLAPHKRKSLITLWGGERKVPMGLQGRGKVPRLY